MFLRSLRMNHPRYAVSFAFHRHQLSLKEGSDSVYCSDFPIKWELAENGRGAYMQRLPEIGDWIELDSNVGSIVGQVKARLFRPSIPMCLGILFRGRVVLELHNFRTGGGQFWDLTGEEILKLQQSAISATLFSGNSSESQRINIGSKVPMTHSARQEMRKQSRLNKNP
jgi:hypothetical protein